MWIGKQLLSQIRSEGFQFNKRSEFKKQTNKKLRVKSSVQNGPLILLFFSLFFHFLRNVVVDWTAISLWTDGDVKLHCDTLNHQLENGHINARYTHIWVVVHQHIKALTYTWCLLWTSIDVFTFLLQPMSDCQFLHTTKCRFELQQQFKYKCDGIGSTRQDTWFIFTHEHIHMSNQRKSKHCTSWDTG